MTSPVHAGQWGATTGRRVARRGTVAIVPSGRRCKAVADDGIAVIDVATPPTEDTHTRRQIHNWLRRVLYEFNVLRPGPVRDEVARVIRRTARVCKVDTPAILDVVDQPWPPEMAERGSRAVGATIDDETLQRWRATASAIQTAVLWWSLGAPQRKPLEDIGKEVGLTRERIRFIQSRILADFRNLTRAASGSSKNELSR